MATATSKLSNIDRYLRDACNLIKGEIAQVKDERGKLSKTYQAAQWKVLCNLIVYAHNGVFAEGYTRKAARKFIDDLERESGLSTQSCARYTNSISAALGVRGIRKGLKSIAGLPAASDDPQMVEKFLKGINIDTISKFIDATRTAKSPVRLAAEKLQALTLKQRQMAMDMAIRMDQDDDADEPEEDDADDKAKK